MASKVLSDADLNALMSDVEKIASEDPGKLKALAEEFARKMVEDKFRRETRYTLRKERMEKAIDLVHHLETVGTSQLRELIRLCCSERG